MSTPSKPATLYKYQPVNVRVLSNLRGRVIWFASPEDFNDPFDCGLQVLDHNFSEADFGRLFEYICTRIGDATRFRNEYAPGGALSERFRVEVQRGAEGMFSEVLADKRGIACFASHWDNLLMWAHYADGHRGICLAFSTVAEVFEKARPVTYATDIPVIRAAEVIIDRPVDALIDATLVTKSQHWEYEQEWRAIHKNARQEYNYEPNALTGVYFGTAIPADHANLVWQILRGSAVDFFQVVKRKGQFGVESRQLSPP